MKSSIYLHIGYGKTGTTLLQEYLFPRLNINYIAKLEHHYPRWLINLHYLDDFSFEKEVDNLRNIINNLTSTKKINLISSEAFLISGEWFKQFTRITRIFNQYDVKIIITLREPIDAIKSFYRYMVMQGNITTSLENSLDFTNTPFSFVKRKPIYIPDYFYSDVISTYQKHFGKGNILVLKYEDLKNNKKLFTQQLLSFLNIPYNGQDKWLTKKVNTSLANQSKLDDIRLEYCKNKILDNFHISHIDIKLENHQTLISKELEKKLKSVFKGRTFGYY